MKLKIKKLNSSAIVPSYQTDGAAAMDFTVNRLVANTTFQITYGTGIAMEIPPAHVGLIFPRSSIRNKELILSNCVGVIDSDYRGEIFFTFNKTNGFDSFSYKVGERCGQMIIMPAPQIDIELVDELSLTKRGDGAFGSTGL